MCYKFVSLEGKGRGGGMVGFHVIFNNCFSLLLENIILSNLWIIIIILVILFGVEVLKVILNQGSAL